MNAAAKEAAKYITDMIEHKIPGTGASVKITKTAYQITVQLDADETITLNYSIETLAPFDVANKAIVRINALAA